MKNGEYWKKRFSKMESEQHRKDEVIAQDIKRQFQLASDNIQEDIEKWYYRLAENNDITYTEAKKLLKADELDEFHWTLEEYIKKGEENAVNQKWIKELENASAKIHINRLQAINLQIQQEAEILHAKYSNSLSKHLKDSYTERFFHTAYEIAKGTGVGCNLARIDSRKIEQILEKPWAQDGANFSDRIWNNKGKLINTLRTELAQHVIRGTDPYNAVQAISKKMDVNKNRASTLVYTETAAIAAAAQRECFKELDVEKFEIVATLDSLTSEICREMDGKHFPMKEYEVGITAPPFHPNCRSVTCPYFEDDYGVPGKRAARGEDGKTYYVPADMTYKEWQQSFVDGDKSGLKETKADDTMELKNKIADADSQITDLKKQFSDITEGYSYDDWFKDFQSIEEGYGNITEADEPDVVKLKDISQKLKDLIQKKAQWKSQLPVLGGQGIPLSIADALKGVNPKFARGTQYAVNCQRCVQTYELRRRGYDVEALPKPKKNNTIAWGNECFVDSSGNTPSFTFNQREKDIRSVLANAPDGSRHIIYTTWKNSRSAHVFIAEKENGIIRFVDPQANKDNVEDYFSRGKEGKFGILRVDDKDITTDSSKIKATVRW